MSHHSNDVDEIADTADELDVMSAPSTPPGKRKRTSSGPARRKKQKCGNNKTAANALNERRAAVDAARRRWLWVHRRLLEPLLPASTQFFRHLKANVDDARCVPRSEAMAQPALVRGGEMKEYQLQGLAFLVWMHDNGMNCVLGDEMGLGKTLQTLSLFAYIKENARGAQDPHLVICPLSVLSSWLAEAARWLPSFRTIRFHGVASERSRLKESLRGDEPFDLCVTTYEAYVADDSWFKSRRWTYCVLDEGHKIKNAETLVARKLQGIGSMFRLILTGTPVQNDLVELWGLLHWLYPGVFTNASERLFKSSFDLSHGTYSLPFLAAAQQLLTTVMLRRTKASVEADVPPREELTVFIPLTELQRFWTYRLLTKLDTMDLKELFSADLKLEDGGANEGRREVLSHLENQIEQGRAGGGNNKWKRLMNLLMQLRKVCDHPYLLEDAEPKPFIIGEHIVAASSKLIVVDKLLADILPKGERVLIFSQWTGMLDLLEDFMALRSIPYARLDGSTRRPRRTLDIRLFQQDVSPYQVYLISTKAGGLGINLTKATTVIMCDSDWNPQNDLQAIARAHRIGQTKTVKVFRLINAGSVEDQMLDRIRRKLFLSVKVMSGTDASADESSTLGYTEVMDILRKGSSALSRSDSGMDLQKFLGADIETILESSRSREGAREAKLKQEHESEVPGGGASETLLRSAEEEERTLLSGIAQVRCRLFEGKMVQRKQENKDIAQEWQELQKRARVDRTVMVDGIQVIAAHLGPEVGSTAIKSPPKRVRAKFEHEDWCQYCRDGGEVILCCGCPRVFHAKCHGVSKKAVQIWCAQHSCAVCERSTAQSGGMLFRCQTCPDAFCEDCLPQGEMDAIGDVLPEFIVLGYGQKDNAYYFRCENCRRRFAEEPKLWEEWQADMREMQRKVEALRA